MPSGVPLLCRGAATNSDLLLEGSSAAHPMSQLISGSIDLDEGRILQQLFKMTCYGCLRESGDECGTGGIQRDLFWLGEMGKIGRLEGASQKIKAESKALENREAANEKYIDAPF